MEEWLAKLGQFASWTAITETVRSLNPTLTRILWVMVGGSLGALCRYGTSVYAAKLLGSRFPWGTLAVNLVGCFFIGVFFALADRTNLLSPSARLFIMTGFLGSLTTFSTFALETVNAVRTESMWIAIASFCLNNMLGIGLVLAGFGLVRLVGSH